MEDKFKKFQELTDQWTAETQHRSSHDKDNAAHKAIVAMGTEAIPFIMYDWDKHPKMIRHWFHALHELTGAAPVPYQDRGRIINMRKHWYKWCINNGYKAYAPIQN